MNNQHSTFARRGEPLAIVAVWAAAIAVIYPRGNFPIDDDWDFALATWRFAETGHFHFTAFTAVSLRAQVLWGALWTRLFGESFDVLRASTLVLAAATLIVVHRMLLRAGVPRFGRIVATLALGFHPVFLWSSCSFMTEVPFVFASAVALACFIRAFDDDGTSSRATHAPHPPFASLRTPSPRARGEGLSIVALFSIREPLAPQRGERVPRAQRGAGEGRSKMASLWILAGCAAALTACFIRQTGVTLLAAPLILAMMRRRKRDAVFVGGTIALLVVIFLLKREWLAGSPAEFAVHFRMWTEETFRLPEQLAVLDHYATFNAQNCALFFLPLVAPLAFLRRRRSDWAILGIIGLIVFVRVQSLIAIGLPMPYFVSPYCCDIFAGNIFVDLGLGPLTLDGVYPFRLPYAERLIITYASVVLAAVLIWAGLRRASRTNASLLALGMALFGSLALLGSGLYVDRYSLDTAWPLVIALPLMLPWQSRAVRGVSVAALIIVAVFSILSVQEYYSWNRARWMAINDLRARGVPITSINAGAEPFYLYELSHGDQRMRRIHQFGVGERPYTVAFEPLAGKRVIARYPFRGWLGLHKGEVLVLSLS